MPLRRLEGGGRQEAGLERPCLALIQRDSSDDLVVAWPCARDVPSSGCTTPSLEAPVATWHADLAADSLAGLKGTSSELSKYSLFRIPGPLRIPKPGENNFLFSRGGTLRFAVPLPHTTLSGCTARVTFMHYSCLPAKSGAVLPRGISGFLFSLLLNLN